MENSEQAKAKVPRDDGIMRRFKLIKLNFCLVKQR